MNIREIEYDGMDLINLAQDRPLGGFLWAR
jgi:hypothetical protein